jgi:hypothetical protein
MNQLMNIYIKNNKKLINRSNQIKNHATIYLVNGLGDKLLDLIGFFILCKYLNYIPQIRFEQSHKFEWGNNHYDNRLFKFNQFIISNQPCPYYIKQSSPSVSLCPYQVYEFISKFRPKISFEMISNDFIVYSKQLIQPSNIILSNIPNGIENAYGIHLRKSDKINNNHNQHTIRHQNTLSEFEIITNNLLNDIKQIIIDENEPTFLIVSEDIEWKNEMTNRVLSLANDKPIQILEINYNTPTHYSNYNSVLDMFCLSKCKEILQGVKYSTFSILASLIGNRNLRNYSYLIPNYDICLIHNWSSVLSINNKPYEFNINKHKNISKHIVPLKTNIIKPFKQNK